MENNSENKENQEKEIAFYSASLQAWFTTKIERDKSLLTLSAGGIGLLITLLSTVGANSVCILLLYISALVFFLLCIISVLSILWRNAEYLTKVIKKEKDKDILLGFLDRFASITFLIGVILSTLLAISIGASMLKVKKEVKMSKIKKYVSMNQCNNLPEKKSFNGISELRPSVENNNSSNQQDASLHTDSQTTNLNTKENH